MAPTKKSRSVNKRQKKELPDKSGSQWNKEELERFYEAYRKYGKDWEKVASVVRSRSAEMVEALYNMNRAFLSLPEGVVSAVGLVAMMTDHYNMQIFGVECYFGEAKFPACRKKDGTVMPKTNLKAGSQPRAVGKRTPRVPVKKRSFKSAFDDEVAHGAALAVTGAAQRDGSPQVSLLPYKKRSKQNSSSVQSCERMVDTEITIAKPEQFSQEIQRKESKKLLYGDVSSDWDALQTLVDLCQTIPTSTLESESSVQLKEGKKTVGKDEKSALPKGTSTGQNRDKIKLPSLKPKVVHAVPGVEVANSKKYKLERESKNNSNALLESKEQPPPADRSLKRKRKVMVSKLLLYSVNQSLMGNFDAGFQVANAKLDSSPSDPLNNVVDEKNKPVIKGKHANQLFTPAKQLNSVGSSESLLCNDQKDLRASTVEIPHVCEVSSSTKQRSRGKTIIRKPLTPKQKSSENMLRSKTNKCSTPSLNRESFLKEKLSGCLSSYKARRWCTFEWFYSAIDYPWFSKREFMECLNHVDLGNIPKLTRLEWSVIKCALGKPRRFSERFLQEERKKLEQYREAVRKYYNELRAGIRDGLPTDLAKPLYVGQRVIVLHSKTREIDDGSVLSVNHDICWVQFDRPELGAQFVKDIDCMPLNPLDSMPEALRWQICAGNVPWMSKELRVKGNSNFEGCMTSVSRGPVEKAPTSSGTLAKHKKGVVKHPVAQSKAVIVDQHCMQQPVSDQSHTVINDQTKEANVHAFSELTCALDKKVDQQRTQQALCDQSRAVINDQAKEANVHAFPELTQALEKVDQHHMQQAVCDQSRTVINDQTKEANIHALSRLTCALDKKVSNALHRLRQHNTYLRKPSLPMVKPQPSFNIHDGPPSTLDGSLVQQSESTVTEIIKASRLRAHGMVDTAFQALSSIKEGEDAFTKIGQVLDCVNYQQLPSSVIRSQEQVNRNFEFHNPSISSEPLLNDASSKKLHNDANEVDIQIPSNLITSCVATLIMIQTCSEGQYPPADVIQTLDSAVTSLHPCSPGNLPIYREIQICMGRIKSQILAHDPTCCI
ncbi:hypothetical protein RJT34_19099 [Clitoria ternatea]|uniref:SANT domain-containing protein n=1 Tax=Clitoria ternatea TaxID=43366 RepID=A0AAN9IQL0_CLITE